MATSGGRVEIAFSISIRVYFQDTDAGEVVYHGTYLDFLERARTEWLRFLGYEQLQIRQRLGILFIVRGLEVKYLSPARLDDLVDVSVAVARIGRAQVTLAQEISRGGATLLRAAVNLACVTCGNFRPQPLPEEISEAFVNAADTTTSMRNPT
jgi:acyl-CoA thioester hydrolase